MNRRCRSLRLETLEVRRLLAVFTVTTASDVVDENDSLISLREAINSANGSLGSDQVIFDPSVFAASTEIDLLLGELDITDSLTISGPQQSALRIDGQGNSRVIDFVAAGDLTLESLTITGGRTIQDDVNASQSGGAIRFAAGGTLTLNDVTVADSTTVGAGARGGGIFAEPGDVVLNRSAVIRNTTSGTGAQGGGIYSGAGTVTLVDSTVSGNTTTLTAARGGGIYSSGGSVSLVRSSLTDNSTLGDQADGGGIFSLTGVTIDQSVVTGNATIGRDSDGGAIYTSGSLAAMRSDISFNRTEGRYAGGGAIAVDEADVVIENSSITHNQTDGVFAYGAGLFAVRSDVTITGSTISSNATAGADADGGGIGAFVTSVSLTSSTVTLNTSNARGGGLAFVDNQVNTLLICNTIVAGNTDSLGSPDFQAPPSSASLTVQSSLIGDNAGTSLDEATTPDSNGNLIGDASGGGLIDPQLDPLIRIGATRMHPLKAASDAVNAGDNSLIGSQISDQRGRPFVRVAGSRVDIGSYELQTINSASLLVTTATDELDFSNSDVSLREAIVAANGQPGSDSVSFDATVFAQSTTIDLQLGELVISQSLSIEGPGRDRLTIDAGGSSRVITMTDGDVTISGLTLTGGVTNVAQQAGGAIRFLADGTLTLQDAVVSGNRTLGDESHGGGIYSRSGQVVLVRSSVTDNATAGVDASGGGVYSGGGLLLLDTTVAGNATLGAQSSGGGIFARVDSGVALEMTRSTVSGNTSAGTGGGISVSQGAIRLSNSTVSQNGSAGDGGGIFLSGNVSGQEHRVVSSTIALNASGEVGGGIYVQADNARELLIRNSIVAANNDLGTHPDLKLSALAGDPSVEASLIGDNSGTELEESQTAGPLGNLIGDSGGGGVIDPLLDRLALRGGLTASHSLLPGSPAIDAGEPLLVGDLTTDQRGTPFVRTSGRRPDMGSYEVQAIDRELFVVDTAVDELDFSNSQLSLREALELADGSRGGDTIRFDPAVFSSPVTIALVLGELWIGGPVSIVGPGDELLAINGQDSSRVLNIESGGADVTISGVTITGGETTGDNLESGGVTETTHSGGGIRFDGTGSLTLRDVTVSGNRTIGAAAAGGGVFVGGGELTLVDSAITLNQTEGDSAPGGGLFVRSADVSIIDSHVSENVTSGDSAGGGGLSAMGATVSIQQSRLEDNITLGIDSTGGAIESRGGDLEVEGTVLYQNSTSSAGSDGGGIFFHDGRLRISNSTLESNSTSGSDSSGGGIAATEAMFLITGSAVVDNDTSGDAVDGGGIFLQGSTTAIINATLSGNAASGTGSSGGAIFSGQTDTVAIVNSTISDNSATGSGGGIFIAPSTSNVLSIANTIVAANGDSGTAPDLKSPINPTNLTVKSSLIGDNTGTTLSEAQTADSMGNLVGSSSGVGVIDPMLTPLAVNGGSVPTHKPLASSPVIDAGDDALATDIDSNPLTSDGRGAPFQRFFGTVDMGSFESQPPREPIIEWSDPANIFVGTELSDLQLNATTNTAGTFSYTPDLGTILSLGDGQTLSVQFSPNDTVHYLSTSASVQINVIEPADFGDAPDTYSTLYTSDGPRHAVGDLRLGLLIDAELDGQPGGDADGDGSDEDGVRLISNMVVDPLNPTTSTFDVYASSSGMLDAWIDFNGNGVFDHPSEHIGGGTSIKLGSRDNIVPVTVPIDAQPGPTYARFRFSSTGGLLPTGFAADGEVEDHVFTILDGSTPQTVGLNLLNGPVSLFSDLGELIIQRRDVELFRASASVVDRFEFIGHPLSNVLTIDTSNGPAVPAGGLSFDGVGSVNTVRLVGPDNSLDLSVDGNIALRNIDVIDISDPAASLLSLDARAVRAMDPTGGGVIVVGSPLDSITFVDGTQWRMADPVEVAGFGFSFVTTTDTFVQVDFARPWQNLAQPGDVNNDGNVTVADALRVINEMGKRLYSDRDTSQLADPSDVDVWPNLYYDVSGEGRASALDALRIINEIARRIGFLTAEGESTKELTESAPKAVALPLAAAGIPLSSLPPLYDFVPADQTPGQARAARSPLERDRYINKSGTDCDHAESSQESDRRTAGTSPDALDQLMADPFFVDGLKKVALSGYGKER